MKKGLTLAVISSFALICFIPLTGCATWHHAKAKPIYNVLKFGAKGDGVALDSPAINKAIEAAAAQGGGTVLVPAGTYLSGSIRMKSNIHLVIDAGARILGAPQNMNAYDEEEEFTAAPAYQDGGHTYFHNS